MDEKEFSSCISQGAGKEENLYEYLYKDLIIPKASNSVN